MNAEKAEENWHLIQFDSADRNTFKRGNNKDAGL